jgi:polyferredoxin
MREQVCTYMCPWPRVQAAMLDEHSLVVTYNDWRGEPRSPRQEGGADGWWQG